MIISDRVVTLSPACARCSASRERSKIPWWERPIRGFFAAFNWFERLAGGYHWLVGEWYGSS
jgi:hypothetical protein